MDKMTTIKNNKRIDQMIDAPATMYRFWERRMHIDDIFEELALPWNTEADVVDMYFTIIKFCKSARVMPVNVAWGVRDNVLYMSHTGEWADAVPLRRVGPSTMYRCNDDEADYWEGLCLSMGEPVD